MKKSFTNYVYNRLEHERKIKEEILKREEREAEYEKGKKHTETLEREKSEFRKEF